MGVRVVGGLTEPKTSQKSLPNLEKLQGGKPGVLTGRIGTILNKIKISANKGGDPGLSPKKGPNKERVEGEIPP